MTKQKSLKKLIRQRMEKTGESYMVARGHVLAAGGERCPACKAALQTRSFMEISEPDDNDSEGQVADYFAAMESGDYGEWGYEVEETWCPRCEPHGVVRQIVRL